MDHCGVETTMIYTHALNRSPIDGISHGNSLKQNRLLSADPPVKLGMAPTCVRSLVAASDFRDTPLCDSSL
jgi:hypothetical protein